MKVKWTKEKQEALNRTMKALEKIKQAAHEKFRGSHEKTLNAGNHTENQSV